MFRLRATSIFLVITALAIAPITVLAQGNLGSVLEGLEDVSKFYQIYREYKDVFDEYAVGGVTVLAFSDEALENQHWVWEEMDDDMRRATLKYHILKGEMRTADITKGDVIQRPTLLTDPKYSNVTGGQRITFDKNPGGQITLTSGMSTRGEIEDADHTFNNGVLHVISTIMRIPMELAVTGRDSFTNLISFLGALYNLDIYDEFINLTDTTVFIPEAKAWQRLAGRFQNEDRSAFRYILRYHIVPGQLLYASQLTNGLTLPTYSRGPGKIPNNITVTREGNIFCINSARILQTDMFISNGVVHVLSDILNPDDQRLPDPSLTSQPPVFTPTGATSTGRKAPTPFITDLPCTKDCPEPEPTDYPTSSHPPFKALPTQHRNAVPPQFGDLAGHGLGLAALGALVVL